MRLITELEPKALSRFLVSIGQPTFRTKQIYQWIYRQGVDSFAQMRNLPKALRTKLEENFSIKWPQVMKILTSSDGTRKFLLLLKDGARIETVLIRDQRRLTLCVSTQAGCRQGCGFCVTGKIGFRRSLLHHEISDQVLAVSQWLKSEKITHLVLMGMGEPLDNYNETIKAIKTWIDPERGGFHPRRITLSTVGLIPEIDRLGKEDLGIKLAISLNAPSDRIRNALMPVNQRFPLSDVIGCLKKYPLSPRQKITLEYCLIRGINDSHSCAEMLSALLKGLKSRVKVNLIPYNENPALPFKAPTTESLQRFRMCLMDKGISTLIRKSKCKDILAACGQLGYEDKEKRDRPSDET